MLQQLRANLRMSIRIPFLIFPIGCSSKKNHEMHLTLMKEEQNSTWHMTQLYSIMIILNYLLKYSWEFLELLTIAGRDQSPCWAVGSHRRHRLNRERSGAVEAPDRAVNCWAWGWGIGNPKLWSMVTWHEMTWNDMKWHEMTWNYMKGHDMQWHH